MADATTTKNVKEDSTLPENLYLFGTTNTTDRLVKTFAKTLRRRFGFTEMRPTAPVLHDNVGDDGVG